MRPDCHTLSPSFPSLGQYGLNRAPGRSGLPVQLCLAAHAEGRVQVPVELVLVRHVVRLRASAQQPHFLN